jgi:PAP2 superfamily
MKARFIVLALFVVAVALGGVAATSSAGSRTAGTPDTSVSDWDAVATSAYAAAGLSAPDGHVLFGYVAIAVYDAVTAIEGGYEPFAVDVDAPAGASTTAAVAAAAHGVLTHYLPSQAPTILDSAYASALAGVTDAVARDKGVAVGQEVADRLIAQRADDGFRAPATYTAPNPPIPGVWIPTAPTPPAGMSLPQMRPFALRSADQLRPNGPPPLSSKRWARDYNETKELGGSTSTSRTPAQTVAARFWAEAPIQQTHAALRYFLRQHGLDVADAARFMGMAEVVFADSAIACFDAKYHYAFWRPVTAVRAGDTDGNDDTAGDPTWSPLLPATPNHPEYPSAHSCITPAVGLVIERFLGTKDIDYTVPSLTGLGDRHFATTEELRDEVGSARIWGGIHFRSAVEDGLTIGRKTVDQVLAHHFRQVGD